MDEITEWELGDLGFDIEPHREGLKAMAALGLDARSMKPTLIARNAVFYDAPGTRFFVGVTGDSTAEQQRQANLGSTHFVLLHHAESPEIAESVRADAARYFLRHFPGRCLPEMCESIGAGSYVFLACFPADHPGA